MAEPGLITLISSGETAHSGGQVFESLAKALPQPLRVEVLETPAGFETNPGRVAGRVADFLRSRLQNYKPAVRQIAARKKGSPLSPDDAALIDPLYDSSLIFFGPGSPTYTVRQLEGSLAWQVIQASQRLGAALVLASAAAIAVGRYVLPVYEIYKVGEDPAWKLGLDLLGAYGLALAVVPHWNNHEGGEEVDTSRCFIGQERFQTLLAQLPDGATVVGLDEHTALTIDLKRERMRVRGSGQAHLLCGGDAQTLASGRDYPLGALGPYRALASPGEGLPETVWNTALRRRKTPLPNTDGAEIPAAVRQMVADRQAARSARDFRLADRLRDQILQAGWQVKDTPEGPQITRADE